MNRIGVLDFVRRQTADSKHDHFEGSWEELISLVNRQWDLKTISPNNPEVLLVPMPESELPRFFASTVAVDSTTQLTASFSPRIEGEAPFIQVAALNGKKSPARRAEIILYSHDVLAKDGDAPPTREAEYYIVSINAYPTLEAEPMSPMTMARNFLNLKGGTRPEIPYTAEEFAHSIIYWSQRVRVHR